MPKEQINMKRPSTEDTAIHLAIKKKDIDMLKLLVDNGGNVDLKNV